MLLAVVEEGATGVLAATWAGANERVLSSASAQCYPTIIELLQLVGEVGASGLLPWLVGTVLMVLIAPSVQHAERLFSESAVARMGTSQINGCAGIQ